MTKLVLFLTLLAVGIFILYGGIYSPDFVGPIVYYQVDFESWLTQIDTIGEYDLIQELIAVWEDDEADAFDITKGTFRVIGDWFAWILEVCRTIIPLPVLGSQGYLEPCNPYQWT